MNSIFVFMISVSIVLLISTSPDTVLSGMISGSKNGLSLAITLFPIYSVWSSILNMIVKTGLDKKIERLFNPLIKRLFKNTSSAANKQIAINMTANFLGMGGASTTSGIKAISLMDKNQDKASNDMIMLFVINCTSIQLIPSTLIALRQVNNSLNPSDIILPSIINTIITTVVGVVLVKIFAKFSKTGSLSYKNNI